MWGEGSRRVGILGGTFDPFHLGHLVAAQDALEVLGLDRLVFIPAGVPPHKPSEGVTPAELRLAMVRAGVEEDPRFEVSDEELRRPGPSYTVDTLRGRRRSRPQDHLFLLVGADQAAGLHRWRESEELARLARLVILSREGEEAPRVAGGFSPPPIHVPVTRVDISSTRVRDRVATGRSIRYLVPDAVAEIIREAGLYMGSSVAPAP